MPDGTDIDDSSSLTEPPSGRRRFRRLVFRGAVLAGIGWFLVVPLIRRVDQAADRLQMVDARYLIGGFVLQVVALWCYSVMTRHALGTDHDRIGGVRLFAVQLSTRAVTSAVPGGAAAGPALGYRLLTRRGVSRDGASSALATAAIGSAFVLNLLLWLALVMSVPLYGFKPLYALGAVAGIVVMMIVAAVLAAVVDGSSIVDRPWGWLMRRFGREVPPLSETLRGFGERIEALLADRRACRRIAGWAAANWLLDAAALWLVLAALGTPVHPIGVLVAFGVANVLAAIPISPGGVGIVEWAYLPMLVAFGASLDQATLGVAVYRVAQWLFPVALGALAYVVLRVEERVTGRGRVPASA